MAMIQTKKYVTVQGIDCVNATLASSLRHYGKEICESDIYFIGNGFQFNYKIKEEIFFNSKLMESHKIFAQEVGLRIREFTPEKPEQWLYNCLDNNQIITVVVETQFLDYDMVFSSIPNTHHVINVIKYDKEFVLISDSYLPTLKPTYYHGTMKWQSFIKAWKNTGFLAWELQNQDLVIPTKEIDELGRLKFRKATIDYINTSDKDILVLIYKALYESMCRQPKTILEKVLDVDYQLKARGYYAEKGYISVKLQNLNCNENWKEEYNRIIKEYQLLELKFIKKIILKDKEGIKQLIKKAKDISNNEIVLLGRVSDYLDSENQI